MYIRSTRYAYEVSFITKETTSALETSNNLAVISLPFTQQGTL